jgi:hypothetical protein
MPGPLLYSCNPFVAFDICMKYRGEIFYAWCSEHLDAMIAPGISSAHFIPNNSRPLWIYNYVRDAAHAEDQGNAKIRNYRKTFRSLARDWFARGEITQAQRDEIIESVKPGSWRIWRPVIYVIPRAPIESTSRRLILAPRPSRAAYGEEYIISDLRRDEFDVVTLHEL